MSKFFTAFNRPKAEKSELGSPIAKTYEYIIDKKTGRKVCVPAGETNIYEMIQASAESCKIENIIKRATNGDLSGLNVRNAQYLDLTEAPTNLMEMQNMIIKATQEFEKLPIEIKNKFGNSAEEYISKYGGEEWAKALNLIEEPKAKIEEVIEKETETNE